MSCLVCKELNFSFSYREFRCPTFVHLFSREKKKKRSEREHENHAPSLAEPRAEGQLPPSARASSSPEFITASQAWPVTLPAEA